MAPPRAAAITSASRQRRSSSSREVVSNIRPAGPALGRLPGILADEPADLPEQRLAAEAALPEDPLHPAGEEVRVFRGEVLRGDHHDRDPAPGLVVPQLARQLEP